MNTQNQNYASSSFISIAGVEMHFCVVGKGPKLVLAFHGYAQNASVFNFLHHDEYTILSFDLPYQGKTVVSELCALEKKDLQGLVLQLMQQFQVSKVSLLGFSLGARVCMCVLETMPQFVRNVVLVAPDGIRHNWFYQLLTNTLLGRLCFRGFVRYGLFYLRIFSLLHYLGWINKTMYKFTLQYIRTAESRTLLYHIWFSTRKLIPRLGKVKHSIRSRAIPVHLLMGQQDVVIPVKNALKFKRKNQNVQVHVFERGHNLLDFEEVRGSLAAWLFRTHQSPKI